MMVVVKMSWAKPDGKVGQLQDSILPKLPLLPKKTLLQLHCKGLCIEPHHMTVCGAW